MERANTFIPEGGNLLEVLDPNRIDGHHKLNVVYPCQKYKKTLWSRISEVKHEAGDGNRTHTISLEG